MRLRTAAMASQNCDEKWNEAIATAASARLGPMEHQQRGVKHAHILLWLPGEQERKRPPILPLKKETAKAPRIGVSVTEASTWLPAIEQSTFVKNNMQGVDHILCLTQAELLALPANTQLAIAADTSLSDIDSLISHSRHRICELQELKRALLTRRCRHAFVLADLNSPRDNGEQLYKCRFCGMLT